MKLVFLLLLTLTLPAGLFLYQSRLQQDQLITITQDRVLKLVETWADRQEKAIDEAQAILTTLASDPGLIGDDQAACLGKLRPAIAGRHGIVAAHVLDADGSIRCSTNFRDLPTLSGGWGFLNDALRSHGLSISGYQRVPDAPEPVFFAAVPISTLSRARGYALVLTLDLSWIGSSIGDNVLGFPFIARLIDRTGEQVIARPQSSDSTFGRLPSDHPAMPRIMIETEGTARGREADGVERLFAFAQIPATGAKLLIGIPRSAVLGDADRLMWFGIGLLVLATATAMALGWGGVEVFLLRWIGRIRRATEEIAEGTFTGSLEIAPSAGELVQLGTALNLMYCRLEERQRQFRDIAKLSSDWFWERDSSGKFTFFSDRFEDATGFHPDEILGLEKADLEALGVFIEDDPGFQHVRASFATASTFRDVVCKLVRRDGTNAWWRVSGMPVFCPEGTTIQGFRGTGTDVTASKLAELALVEAKTAAEQANLAKTQFLATMSHELRTPLNAVIGFSQILEGEMLGPVGNSKYVEYSRDIRKSGQHLLAIVMDILDLSQIESGRMALDDSEFSISTTIDLAVRMVAERALEAKLALAPPTGDGEYWVIGDERRILQCVLNLLTNAIKFTLPGGLVSIACAIDADENLRIEVRDTGIGINQNDLPNVGNLFWQAEGSLSRRREGAGIGLALTRRLIELHDGKLVVRSQSGVGTVVQLIIPHNRFRRADPTNLAISLTTTAQG